LIGNRYRLGAALAGAGHRWEATDTVLARPVIVELGEAGGPAASAATGRLSHPCIVTVYDTGTHDGRPYVVSELARGRTLQAVADATGTLSPARVVIIGRQLTAALAAAHDADVVHGHLGLDAVVLDEDDRAKVGGFSGPASHNSGRAADVHAVGHILYQLLCGQAPTADPVAPRRLRAGVPPDLDAAIMAALAADTTAAALNHALNSVDIEPDDAAPEVVREPTPPTGIRPLPRSPARRRPAGLIGGLAVVAVALAVVTASLVMHNPGHGRTPSAHPPAAAIVIIDVKAFDPLGDHHENDAELPLVHDGNPATVWSTETYNNRHFGNLKSGVGLYLVLDHQRTLTDLTVDSPSVGWTAQVFVASQPAPALAGWGRPAAQFTVNGPVTPVSLGAVQGGAVLVWITELSDTGRVDIGELILG
jgi:hypothetical protein